MKDIDHNRGPYCQTLTGGMEHCFDPAPEDIDVRDMRALSRICRFGGHIACEGIYSVAEHSWRCAQRAADLGLSPDEQWAALVHDAHEAYGLGDVRGPMKSMRAAVMPRWKTWVIALEEIEALHSYAVRVALKTSIETPSSVKEIDLELLATERRDLMVDSSVDWGRLPHPLHQRIVPQSPARAFSAFADAWNRLKPDGVQAL